MYKYWKVTAIRTPITLYLEWPLLENVIHKYESQNKEFLCPFWSTKMFLFNFVCPNSECKINAPEIPVNVPAMYWH